jgi:hypothetical protein
MAEWQGASGEIGAALLDLQVQLFAHWQHWKDGEISWFQLKENCQLIRRQFEATL